MTLPRLSRRSERIQPFQTMELIKRAAVMEQLGKPVLHMSIGEPDFTAPPPVIEALERAVRAGRTQYTPATGIAPLREAIAGHYRDQYGLSVDPQRIVVTAGASAALTLACCALVDPGDQVLMTDPSYPCNRHFVASYDGVPSLVPVCADTRFQMTRDLLVEHWAEGVTGTLLASPANPTGTSIALDEMSRIVDAVRERGGFTIVDEIYLGLTYDREPRSALELGDDLIVTNSFSKYFHMTGWRLGWLVVPPSLVASFEKLAQNLYICASALAQHAALGCFTPQAQDEFRRRRDEFRQRRDFVVPALRSIGLDVPVNPDGAFYVYADCSRHCEDSARLADEILEHALVSVVPGADFGLHDHARYLRLSYASPVERLAQAVERIGNYLAGRPAA